MNKPTQYQECIVLAPSQIANAFGPLDRIGVLGKRPPFSPDERIGGPGNWIYVRRTNTTGKVDLTIDLRECDEQGYWRSPKPFSSLLDEINRNPEKDLVRILVQKTRRHISRHLKQNLNDGLAIHLVIHSPNGKTGLGLGGSASSSAIVIAIDALYGFPIANSHQGDIKLMRLMAYGEKIASGRIFFDNVAPLSIKAEAVYLRTRSKVPEVVKLTCPQNLHITTITPDFSVSTAEATAILKGRTIDVFEAEAAASRYMDIRHALYTGDLELLIKSAGNSIVEPIRGKLIHGFDVLHQVINQLNYSSGNIRFSYGISGSGPTMYILAKSYIDADRAGYEVHRALLEKGIFSWWFCHTPNSNGAEIIEIH